VGSVGGGTGLAADADDAATDAAAALTAAQSALASV